MQRNGCLVRTSTLYRKLFVSGFLAIPTKFRILMSLGDGYRVCLDLKIYNDGYKYLLNVMFSRHAWKVPLQNRIGTSVTRTLKSLFQHRKSTTVQSDKGTEFLNAFVQRYLKKRRGFTYDSQSGYTRKCCYTRFVPEVSVLIFLSTNW
jgi:hypothetical protein